MTEVATPISVETPETPSDIVEVQDLDQFVRHLTAWHTHKVAAVKHLLDIPEGSEFEVGGKSIVMTGDALTGFKLGVEMALMPLGELPFLAELEEEASPTPAG